MNAVNTISWQDMYAAYNVSSTDAPSSSVNISVSVDDTSPSAWTATSTTSTSPPRTGRSVKYEAYTYDLLDNPLWLGLTLLGCIVLIACIVAFVRRLTRKLLRKRPCDASLICRLFGLGGRRSTSESSGNGTAVYGTGRNIRYSIESGQFGINTPDRSTPMLPRFARSGGSPRLSGRGRRRSNSAFVPPTSNDNFHDLGIGSGVAGGRGRGGGGAGSSTTTFDVFTGLGRSVGIDSSLRTAAAVAAAVAATADVAIATPAVGSRSSSTSDVRVVSINTLQPHPESYPATAEQLATMTTSPGGADKNVEIYIGRSDGEKSLGSFTQMTGYSNDSFSHDDSKRYQQLPLQLLKITPEMNGFRSGNSTSKNADSVKTDSGNATTYAADQSSHKSQIVPGTSTYSGPNSFGGNNPAFTNDDLDGSKDHAGDTADTKSSRSTLVEIHDVNLQLKTSDYGQQQAQQTTDGRIWTSRASKDTVVTSDIKIFEKGRPIEI